MASANAIVRREYLQQLKRGLQTESLDEDSAEDTPLFPPDGVEGFESQPYQYYVIQEKFEMGQMASLFFYQNWTVFVLPVPCCVPVW